MKAIDARIAWTPAFSCHPTAGRVKIGVRSEDWKAGWSQPYRCWIEAAEDRSFHPDGWLTIGMVFVHFHTLVVRDGILPQVAHEAFLAIDEYRQRMSEGIAGAEDVPVRGRGCSCKLTPTT